MEQQERQRLTEVMRLVAGGDRAAVVALYVEFGGRVLGVVRRHLRRLGVEHVGADDLGGLVVDSCLAIADCASGWDPEGGAAPWTWAEHRIRRVVVEFVGQHADELDEAADVPGSPAGPRDEPEPLALLGRADLPVCRLLLDALDVARLSHRDRRLFLDYEVQRASVTRRRRSPWPRSTT